MYVRFEVQKQSYFSGIRLIISLNGCHLKTSLGAQLLCAIDRDGNDNMFPIVMAVVDIENKKLWVWFLQLTIDDFGYLKETGWVFMSNQWKICLPCLLLI